MNALELQGLTKHYKDFTLGPLDLTLPGGTICGLIGENGAGKSTTIKLILDMLQRDGGTVTILGRDNRTDLVHTKEEIGVVLGSDGIPLCLNAVEVGKVMAGIYRNWDAGDYTAFCRKFDLPPDKKYKDYSAGMQRKLCIAVALSHHAKLLLLDEATNGLDPVVRDEILDNGAEIEAAIREAKGFVLDESNKLKRLPKGYAPGSPYDEWLKLKDVYITERLAPEFMLDKELLKNTLHEFRKTKHFSDILNRAVQFAYDEMI